MPMAAIKPVRIPTFHFCIKRSSDGLYVPGKDDAVECFFNLQSSDERVPNEGPLISYSPSRTKEILAALGPGLVTGASDDDPSGIATYSQVGAQFGYGMLWTMLFTFPLMAGIQEISARVGRVTGRGIGAN